MTLLSQIDGATHRIMFIWTLHWLFCELQSYGDIVKGTKKSKMLLPNSICVSVSTPLSNIIANCIVFYKWKKAFSSSSEQQACFHYRAFVLFLPQKCTSLTNNCQALVCHPQITPPRALNKPPRAFHEPTQLSPSVTLMLWYTEAIWFSSQLLNFLEILQTHDMTW